MRDDLRVVALVTRTSGGDQDAWNELADRCGALVYTICTRYRLSNHDLEDVGQNVWRLGTWLDDSVLFADDAVIEEEILVAERNAALRVAFAQRARCLERLRRSDVLAALGEGEEKINIRGGELGA